MKGDLDMIITNMQDAKLYQEYQNNVIDYKVKFNGILADIAADKAKISDLDAMEEYFQKVIDGTIPDPSKDQFKPTNLADYKYLLSLKRTYPLIDVCVRHPSNQTGNNTTNGSALDLNNNT
jgi:hypothetical protein